jgi:hypothetical protein
MSTHLQVAEARQRSIRTLQLGFQGRMDKAVVPQDNLASRRKYAQSETVEHVTSSFSSQASKLGPADDRIRLRHEPREGQRSVQKSMIPETFDPVVASVLYGKWAGSASSGGFALPDLAADPSQVLTSRTSPSLETRGCDTTKC